jgi:hypothetical protein
MNRQPRSGGASQDIDLTDKIKLGTVNALLQAGGPVVYRLFCE